MLNDAFWNEDQNRYVAKRENHEFGRTIEGLRYARHRLVHDMSVYGMHGKLEAGVWGQARWGEAVFGTAASWVWRKVNELDEWNHDEGKHPYREHLEGRSVIATLEGARSFLNWYRKTEP